MSTTTDPQALIEELTADLDRDDAIELATELTRMIDLGLLEVDGGDELRLGIAGDPS